MRCLSCDTVLTSSESTKKYDETGEYIDLCTDCFTAAFTYDPVYKIPEKNNEEIMYGINEENLPYE